MPIPAGDEEIAANVVLVRTLTSDLDPDNPLLTDEQVELLLTLEGDNVKLAAATALETIARSEALISKKITTQDLSTDGPAVAKELRASAQALRDQVAAAAAAVDEEGLDIVYPVWSFPAAPWHGDLLL